MSLVSVRNDQLSNTFGALTRAAAPEQRQQDASFVRWHPDAICHKSLPKSVVWKR
jgi:hypothetical protein